MSIGELVPGWDKRYWERLLKRELTDEEFGAAAGAVLNVKDRRAKKREGLKAIQAKRQAQISSGALSKKP